MNRSSLFLILSVSILFFVGLLMVFNTTAAEVIDRSSDLRTHFALFKQLAYGFVGIFLGTALYFLGHEKILSSSFFLLGFFSVLLVLVFVPGIGMKINGANRWLAILGFPIGQPSEAVKILLPAAFIHWFSLQKKPITLKPFLKMLLIFSMPIGLILIEPDNGAASLICLLLVILFFLAKIPFSYWALPLGCLTLLGGAIAFQMPHVQRRIQVYLHPELDLKGKGHQPYQAKIAAGSGRLFGKGIGQSLQKLNYLPEARSDYIAAIYAEETGFFGIFLLIALYITLGASGFLIAMNTKETSSFLFASILVFFISIQAFINLGVVSALLPSKGMALPYFSQGGSSLIVNLIAFFLLLDISRKQKRWVRRKN